MKLGQKVRFEKYLKKEKAKHYFEDNVGLLYETIELGEPLEGIVSGKRTIVLKGHVDIDYFEFDADEYKQVYLIACDMRGFYRVPEEWLEVIE